MIYIFACTCKIISKVCSSFFRASNSSIKVKYKGYRVASYYLTPNRTVGGANLIKLWFAETIDFLIGIVFDVITKDFTGLQLSKVAQSWYTP